MKVKYTITALRDENPEDFKVYEVKLINTLREYLKEDISYITITLFSEDNDTITVEEIK